MDAPSLDPRTKASLLWGLVALLSFLVLLQGYEVLADEPVTVGVKAIVSALVGIVGAGGSYLTYGRLFERRPG